MQPTVDRDDASHSVQPRAAPADPIVRIFSPQTGRETTCSGPASDGACPRVARGHVLPCAGAILAAPDQLGGRPYQVGATMTICPLTLAASLGVLPQPHSPRD